MFCADQRSARAAAGGAADLHLGFADRRRDHYGGAFSQTYWQLLGFRVISGIGSTMFYVSALGLMIHISPPDARGRIAGMFTTSFMVGAVAGPAVGGLAAHWGMTAPFIVYGIGLMCDGGAVLQPAAFGVGGTCSADGIGGDDAGSVAVPRVLVGLFSNFVMGWSAFGLRIALVPVVIFDVMGRGVGAIGLVLAAFAGGNALAVIPSGYLSDRMGRRTLLIMHDGIRVATFWLGAIASLSAFVVAAVAVGAMTGIFMSPMQAAVADILGNEARAGTPVAAVQMSSDLGAIIGSMTVGWVAEQLSFAWDFGISGVLLLVAAVGWVLSPETRPQLDPAAELMPSEPDAELA